ncbi:MAG: hypothetical protein LBM70_10100, partial [Victivallales bacterium]|nr:hypothetical protein [Victivallales bacterium]
MVYNFIRKKNDNSLSYDDTVVFLGPTVDPYDAYDGGAIYYCYIGPSVQPTGVSGEYAFRVSDGSRVVLGKGMQIDTSDPQYNATYNLRMDVHSTLRSTRALSFSGDGEIDFSPANSYGKPGRVDKIKYSTPEQMIEVRNVADTTVWGDIDPSVTGIPPADGDVDASAYGIESTGILRVISNMSAFIAAKSAVTLCPYYVLKVLLYRNPSSDNLSMAVAIRADSLQIDGNFTGVLKSTNSFQVSNSELDKLRLNDNSIYDNAIGSYGICADKEITISGEYCGRIYSDITDVSIVNDVAELAAKAKNYPVVSYNTVVANGIYGGGITFGAPVLGRIYASVNDVTISAESNDANYPARVASNSVDCYAIRSSGDIVFNDAFEAILSSQVDNIQIKSINRPGVSEPRLVANNITAVGIYTYDDIIAKKNFGGEIVVDLSTDPYDDVALLEIRVAALHASNISVINGYLRSSISIESFYDIDISSEYNDESYVCGVFADTLTAAGFAGDIGVHAKTVTGGSSVSGFLINDYLANGNDEIFDFAGTIWVDSKDRAFGIMGSTARAMNIRISGSVDSPKYAVVAGRYSSNSPDFVLSGFDDTVEIAAGAYVAGDIELGDGINKVIIDSNARLKGDILNTNGYGTPVGMTDIEFLLNDHPFEINGVPIQAPSQYKNDAIIEINNRTYNPSRLNINLNLNDVDLSGGPRTYKLVHGENMTAWQNETLGINYQNLRCLVSVGQVISYEGIEIETSIVDGSLMLTVNALPAVSAEKPSAITGLTESVNHNAETVILSWDNAGYQGSCDVEYRIGGGKTFVQKTQNGDNSITLSNITEKQTVEWRVRKNQNSGGRNFTSDWSYGNKVTMAAADYVYSKVTDTYAEFTGFAGTDLTANLTWSKGATYSEGVKGYAVRYFQSRRPVNGAIDWENTAVMTKEVTAPELLIAGLNTDQYLYWQVQAVDKIDGSSDSLQINPDNWVDGETVIYNPDTTDPTFTNGQSAILDSSIYWADPTTIGSNETHTMDPYLRWAYAQDDNLGVGSYKLSIREQSQTPGAGNAWTTFEIPVISILQIAFNFRLSDWIAQNPGTQMKLLENATYEWSLIAEDYAGNQSTALTGAWVKNAEVPILDASAVLSNTEWMGGDKPLRANIVWDAAQDNNPPTLRYELQYRLSGSSGSWTTKTISVKDSLSWAVDLANSDWEYKLTAYNVAGNASNTVTGTWYADNVAPVFVDASKVKASDAYDAITKNNTITFTWSNASDNSATRPKSSAVSGVDHFVLSFVDSDGKRQTLGN